MAFKNNISERFYNWCKALIDRGELTSRQLSEIIGKYQNNPSNVLGVLKSGQASVTIEWLLSCQQSLGLNPCIFFDKTKYDVKEDDVLVINDRGDDVGPESANGRSELPVRLHELFKKHSLEINEYSRTRLNISRQQLHNYLNGKSRIPLDLAVTVCEDLGESLDIFRSRPVPMGHMQERINFLTEQLKSKEETIKALQSIDKNVKSMDKKKDASD